MARAECAFKKPEITNIVRTDDGLQHYVLHCDENKCPLNPQREIGVARNIRGKIDDHISKIRTAIEAQRRYLCINTTNPRRS